MLYLSFLVVFESKQTNITVFNTISQYIPLESIYR